MPGCVNLITFLSHKYPVIAEIDPQYLGALESKNLLNLEFFCRPVDRYLGQFSSEASYVLPFYSFF